MNRRLIFACLVVLSLSGCACELKKSAESSNSSPRFPLLYVRPEEPVIATLKKNPDAAQPWIGNGRMAPLSITDLGLAGNIRLALADIYLDGGSHVYVLADEKDQLFVFCTSNPSDSARPAFHLGRLHFTESGSIHIPVGSPSYEFLYRLVWSFSKDARYQIDPEVMRRTREDMKISEKKIKEMMKEPN